MATFSNNLGAKTSKNEHYIFYCDLCDYKSSKKYNWERHLMTPKHIKSTHCNKSATNSEQKEQLYECKHCSKQYNDRTGLWRHKKKCVSNENTKNETVEMIETMNDKELIQFLMKENSEFKQLMMEQSKTMTELAKTTGSHNTINSNNNQFNLNFYLNETCKNAMNIMDFVSQLQVGIKDLEETGRLGYAEGISKIFINGLKNLQISDRPIHCSDFKREVLYIKSNNEWNKETDNKTILTSAIKQVAHKNIKQISEWTKIHPEHNDPESKENDKYLRIVSESMSGSSEEESNKNYSKIIKNIVKETVIDKNV